MVTHFNFAMKEHKIFDMIDSRIRDECKLEQVMMMAKLAKVCLNLKESLNIDAAASTSTSQYNTNATLWYDSEPLFPRQTW